MGVTHIRAHLQTPGMRVAAICDPTGRGLDGNFSDVPGNVGSDEPVKLDMNEVKAYLAVEDLFANDTIDLFDICAPTTTHEDLAVAALETGKHVLCEKPLARTVEQARCIAKAAGSSKGHFMTAMCLRFWPEWAWLKRAVEGGRYGRVLAAHFRRVAEPPAWGQGIYLDGQRSGGALLDLHVHDVDFVHHLFGMPKSVYATGFSKVSGAIDHVLAQYEVEGGASVSATGSWAMTPGFGFNMAYRVVFENATADYDIARAKESLRLFEADGSNHTIAFSAGDGYAGEMQHLAESIEKGEAPSVTADDGVAAVEICAAEEESINTGKVVPL